MATLSEELSTLKELLDKGIITQEEFESKKAQLLAAPAGSLSNQVPSGTDDGGVGWLVLGLFIPIVGLILYLVWKDTKPLSAQQAGKGAVLYDHPLNLDLRGTEFQLKVWKAIMQVPFGETISYQQLAANIGQPEAVRAVATAVGQNPMAVIIPCHRIIHKDGTIGEYHWGRELKEKLLEWEKARKS